MGPKQKIFALLNQANTVISGEALSAELGISRVSIWTHIQGLVQSGISIVSSPKGYRLTHDPDSLHPLTFDIGQDLLLWMRPSVWYIRAVRTLPW